VPFNADNLACLILRLTFLSGAKPARKRRQREYSLRPRPTKRTKFNISENPDLLICETHLMPFSGLELLARIPAARFECAGDPDERVWYDASVIESMKLGAFDYLRKESLPFNLKPVVDAALNTQAEMRSATAFKPQLTVEQYQDSLVGQSQPMQQVFKMIGRVSHSDAPVMNHG